MAGPIGTTSHFLFQRVETDQRVPCEVTRVVSEGQDIQVVVFAAQITLQLDTLSQHEPRLRFNGGPGCSFETGG